MQHYKQLDRIAGYTALVAAILIIGLVILWPFERARYCGSEETLGQCTREWLGIIIGAATVFGGVIAAWVVFKTIGPLQEQLGEMRRQTSFMLGNESPTVELLPASSGRGRLRIVNWNARAFTWRGAKFSHQFEASGAMKVTIRDYVHNILRDGVLVPCLVIEGWENRSGPPPSVTLDLVFAEAPEFHITRDLLEKEVVIEIVGELSGEAQRCRTIRTCAAISSLFHRTQGAPPSTVRA